ncbi:hypothetical protein Tco_0885434 [Tanacetum coccineum]
MDGFKECSSCGALYNREHCCSNVSSVDNFVRDPNPISYDETPDSSQQPPRNCSKCGGPFGGLHCRQCTCDRCRKKFMVEVCSLCCGEDGKLFDNCPNLTYFKDFYNSLQQPQTHSAESFNDNPNFGYTPQEPFVYNQDPSEIFSQSRCGDPLDDLFCQRCTCKFYGINAHYGYDCPPQVPFIYNPEPCYNQDFENDFPQNFQSYHNNMFVVKTAGVLMRLFNYPVSSQPPGESIKDFFVKHAQEIITTVQSAVKRVIQQHEQTVQEEQEEYYDVGFGRFYSHVHVGVESICRFVRHWLTRSRQTTYDATAVTPPLDFVPKPMYPEYMPLKDEILPTKEQPMPTAASPTVDSLGYVIESDLEEEPEEDDEDPEEDPIDYPANRDDDEEEGEEEKPSRDDADDEDKDKDEEEEEEEHPSSANSIPPVYHMTAKISIWDEPSISLPPREKVKRLLALTTPPPSPLTLLLSPLPQIPSPPLPASPPASVLPALPLASPTHPLGYRAAMIRLRAETPSTSHPLPLPTSSPPLCEVGESLAAAAARPIGGRRADYGFVGTIDTEIRRQRAEEVGYGIRDVWVDPREAVEEDRQTQIYQRVETLGDDSQYHYKTARLLDQEALVSREAWGRSIEAANRRSQVVTSEMLQADHMRQAEIAALQTFDRTRQEQLVQTLTLIQSLQG